MIFRFEKKILSIKGFNGDIYVIVKPVALRIIRIKLYSIYSLELLDWGLFQIPMLCLEYICDEFS